jgi:oxygen-independent coproporphyrinogen-3 oxidase
VIDQYVEALVAEIKGHSTYTDTVTSIFLGGGTPSILSGDQMEQIFHAVRAQFDVAENAEITIEANPGTVTKEKLDAYRRCGINRISFGLQSANNEELKLLGRIHTYEEFLESFRLAREAGFGNINVDLISAIPKQTLQSFEETLQKVIALNPEHISAYSLIVEEGTPFAKLYGEGGPKEQDLPSEEEERLIYKRTEELLNQFGYHRYEISNYAKPGRECRHNLGYWERKNYLGLGLGSASLMDNVRYKNTDDLDTYLKQTCEPDQIQEQKEILSVTEQMEEFMFLGLRKMKGISEKEFETQFGNTLEECYGKQIERFLKEGLLERKDGYLNLTKPGINVSNYALAEFLH